MQPVIEATAPSKGALWTGRVISALVVLFLCFDGVTKVMKVPSVMAASARAGFSVKEIVIIGVVLLICTLLYVIPTTAVLGAILLTGYLGGATFANAHTGGPVPLIFFPVVFGILTWLGIFLRDSRIRALIPLRVSR
ncbi:MAG: DoxX family protein [Candidatus Acidiferrales bacterium]